MEQLLATHQQDPHRSRLARIFGVRPLGSESARWYWGALGELAVGRSLTQLGPEWTVLHAVPVGRDKSDIDHVVIEPGGVFHRRHRRSEKPHRQRETSHGGRPDARSAAPLATTSADGFHHCAGLRRLPRPPSNPAHGIEVRALRSRHPLLPHSSQRCALRLIEPDDGGSVFAVAAAVLGTLSGILPAMLANMVASLGS